MRNYACDAFTSEIECVLYVARVSYNGFDAIHKLTSACAVLACTNTLMSISIDPFFPINTMIFFFHLVCSFDIPILGSKNFSVYIQ